jgi:hypothetical protein
MGNCNLKAEQEDGSGNLCVLYYDSYFYYELPVDERNRKRRFWKGLAIFIMTIIINRFG